MNRYSILGVASVFALLIGLVTANVEAVEYAGLSYESTDDFWEKIGAIVSEMLYESGEFQDISEPDIERIDGIIDSLRDDEGLNSIIRQYKSAVVVFSNKHLFVFGCLFPADFFRPLNIGDSIQCGVLFIKSINSEVSIDDLHIYAVTPSGTIIPIQDWDWATSTIPDPFLWVSDPITFNEVGKWQIVADFTVDKEVVLTLDVSFKVIPESIIGVAGLVAGPLVVLAYKLRKRNH